MKKNESENDNKEIIIDMPEVKDIPGQEHVKPPHFGEMYDSTASSADEEGEGILDDLNKDDDEDLELSDSMDLSDSEKKLLEQTDRPVTGEDLDLKNMALDKLDEDDEVLEEEGDAIDMGDDLDIPGADLDDDDENLGEEDEENNSYSEPD